MRARSDALERLVTAARALPGERSVAPSPCPFPEGGGGRQAGAPGADVDLDAAALRRRVGALPGELARRLEPALREALDRAGRAWDQVDDLWVTDAAIVEEAAALRGAWRRAAAGDV